MTATPETETTAVSRVRAARRVFIRHHRRRYPDTGRCAFCGDPWLPRDDVRLVEGCEARQYVAGLLQRARQLDPQGHLVHSLWDHTKQQSGS